MSQRRSGPDVSGAVRQDDLRPLNLSLVLRHVHRAFEPPSRADVARHTGLTRGTVSALVDHLLRARLVAEAEPVPTRRAGRPAVRLVPASGTFVALGLEVNVSYLGVRAYDLAGRVLVDRLHWRDHRDSRPGPVLARLAALAGEALSVLGTQHGRVVGAGVALPGLVDAPAGMLRIAPNLGWSDVPLGLLLDREPLRELSLVVVGNEANLGARAQLADTGPDASFVYVSGEVGAGAGLVLDGRVLERGRGWSGEIGHVTVEPDGPQCACGSRGCLEQYAGRGVLMSAAGLPLMDPTARLAELAQAGEAPVRAALDRGAWALGVALADLINLVEVDEVLLGGFYAELEGLLIPGIEAELRRRVLSARWSLPRVRAVADGQHAALQGAALAVLERLVADPVAHVAQLSRQ